MQAGTCAQFRDSHAPGPGVRQLPICFWARRALSLSFPVAPLLAIVTAPPPEKCTVPLVHHDMGERT